MIIYKMASADDCVPVNRLLHEIDKTFPIPLSEKIDIDELTEKFLAKGYVYLAMEGEMPLGMLGFYANDMDTRSAYFSVLGVLESHQGQGIASRILVDALTFCKEKGMTSCVLYTHKTNSIAIKMYQKFGFVPEEDPLRAHDMKFVKKL